MEVNYFQIMLIDVRFYRNILKSGILLSMVVYTFKMKNRIYADG